MTQTEPRRSDSFVDEEDEFGAQMSLVEHLTELRDRILKAGLAVVIAFAIAFIFRDRLFELLIGPYCELPDELRGASGVFSAERCSLIVTNVMGPLFITLKASAVLAVVLAAPPVCYQVWRFITPGLRHNERKFALPFVVLTFVLFAGGAVFAYFVIPRGLEFLVGFAGENVVPLLDADQYISFLLKTMLGFGLSFLMPLVLAMLTLADIISSEGLRTYRRHAMFGAFVLAAIITPTQDPFTMLVMGGPLILFYEGNIIFARVVERRRGRPLPA
ncbi:MAG TPA: twin-arginine translocase subunit TatC [Euzebyales bacterium]|nr:twin-arginine translocase subunit TatC [Euzebyales bacterium]